MTSSPDAIWNPARFSRIRKGWPSAPRRAIMPAVSADLCMRIGQVAIGWAMFERYFNQYIQALLTATGRSEDGWQWREFSKRLALFRSLMREAYSAHGSLLIVLERLCHEASDIHRRRSVILHGMAGSSSDYKEMQFTGRHKGKPVTHKYDSESITDLACRIWLLSGELNSLVEPRDGELGLAADDMAAVRDFAAKYHPDLAIPGAPSPLAETSGD